jgi:hypothetical protein
MDHDPDTANWREEGIDNWARDLGFMITKEDGLYNLWSPRSQNRTLENVELDDIENYLGRL